MNVSESLGFLEISPIGATFYSVMLFVGTISNLLLVICIAKDPLNIFRNPSSYLVANLGLGDLESCAGQAVLYLLLQTGNRRLVEFLYRNGLTSFGSDVSITFLTVLAVERYFCVAKPIKYRVWFTNRKTCAFILLLWSFHVLRMSIVGYNLHKGFLELNDFRAYSYIVFALLAVVSLVCNIVTLFTVKRQEINLRKLQRGDASQIGLSHNRFEIQTKFLVTMVILASCLAVTLVPFGILMILGELVENLSVNNTSYGVLKVFYLMNFVINPLIYIWRMPRYRRSMMFVMSCKIT